MTKEEYDAISYKITGAIFEVSNKLGCGFLEKVYERALGWELEQRGLKVEYQKKINFLYKGVDLGLEYYADIVVDGGVIVELKAIKGLEDVHRAQVLNYLRATQMGLGVLVNFGTKRAEIERFAIYNDPDFTPSYL